VQSLWQKLVHVLSGPSKSPTEKHYDDAKRAGSNAYDHAGNVRNLGIPMLHVLGSACDGIVGGVRSLICAFFSRLLRC
jgi:hypothetical protein